MVAILNYPRITPVSKPDKDAARKENFILISLITSDVKILGGKLTDIGLDNF